MEHVVCFSCCKTLQQGEEILMCGICEIWQHFKCTKGVSPSFYLQFYLSMMDDSAAPTNLRCPHCSQVDASEGKKTQEPSLVLPEKGHSSHKLSVTLDSTRTSREGPAPDLTPSLASLENRDQPTSLRMIFKPYQLAITFEPANPTGPSTANKRPREDLSDSSDGGIPAKVYKTSADFSFSCDSDSDDGLAITTLCDKMAEDSDLDLDCAPNPDVPSSPVATTVIPVCHRTSADFSFSCDSDSDDGLAITTLCDKMAEDSDLDLDCAPNPDVPSSPVATTVIPVCHSSDKHHVEPEMTPDITYSLSEGTGKGTKSFLTDSHGYTYQIKYKLGARVFWTCTEKKSRCRATIIQQRKDQFSRGAASHNHGSSQSQTSTGTVPNSEAPDEQAQTSTSPGTISEPAISQSKKSISSSFAPVPAVNQSQTSRSTNPTIEPAASQSTTRPSTGLTTEPAVSQSDDAGDKLPLGKDLISTKKSTAKKVKSTAPAKKVKSTAPAKKVKSAAPAKKKALVKAPPPPMPPYSAPASPLTCGNCNNEATFQEVSTCPRYGRKEQSYLIDPEYYMYKTKIEDEKTQTTTWKCTHIGDDGTKCPGKVQKDGIRQFNVDDNYYYDWTYDHNDHSRIRTQPHNHSPDKTTAVDHIIKANIHAMIFGYKDLFATTDDILTNAYDWLHDHESLEAPSMHLRRYKRYIYTKKNEFRTNFVFFSRNYRIFTPWTDEEEQTGEEDTDEKELTDEEVDSEEELTGRQASR